MNSLATTLPGTWRLLSRVVYSAAGERRSDPAEDTDHLALLYYDRAGNFAAQFMKRDRSGPVAAAPASAPNNSRSVGGYDAYFGTYTVNEAAGSVTQRLAGALAPENVGLVVTRRMSVDGDTLIVRVDTTSPQGEAVVRTLTWQRAG